MKRINCSGTRTEIGRQHGQAAKTEIERGLRFYEVFFQKTAGLSWSRVCDTAAKFEPLLLNDWPDYCTEMKGVAEGAGVSYLSILAMNVRTEIAFGLARDGCTAIFWKTDMSSFLAQNWDWQEEQQRNLINLSISQKGKPAISMITEAGIIGKIGLNSRGVGVCLNAIRAQGVDFQRLPCHLALRTCLESTSTEEAVLVLRKAGLASACHITLADSESAVGLECSHVDIVELAMEQGILTHTNHYLKPHHGVEDLMALKDSPTRFERINQLVREQTKRHHNIGTLRLEDIRSLLKDEANLPTAICRSKTDDSSIATLFNIVMDLKNRRAEVVTGKPSSSAEIFHLVPVE